MPTPVTTHLNTVSDPKIRGGHNQRHHGQGAGYSWYHSAGPDHEGKMGHYGGRQNDQLGLIQVPAAWADTPKFARMFIGQAFAMCHNVAQSYNQAVDPEGLDPNGNFHIRSLATLNMTLQSRTTGTDAKVGDSSIVHKPVKNLFEQVVLSIAKSDALQTMLYVHGHDELPNGAITAAIGNDQSPRARFDHTRPDGAYVTVSATDGAYKEGEGVDLRKDAKGIATHMHKIHPELHDNEGIIRVEPHKIPEGSAYLVVVADGMNRNGYVTAGASVLAIEAFTRELAREMERQRLTPQSPNIGEVIVQVRNRIEDRARTFHTEILSTQGLTFTTTPQYDAPPPPQPAPKPVPPARPALDSDKLELHNGDTLLLGDVTGAEGHKIRMTISKDDNTPNTFIITIVSPGVPEQTYHLSSMNGAAIQVGRDSENPNNNLLLNIPEISRQHGMLTVDGGRIFYQNFTTTTNKTMEDGIIRATPLSVSSAHTSSATDALSQLVATIKDKVTDRSIKNYNGNAAIVAHQWDWSREGGTQGEPYKGLIDGLRILASIPGSGVTNLSGLSDTHPNFAFSTQIQTVSGVKAFLDTLAASPDICRQYNERLQTLSVSASEPVLPPPVTVDFTLEELQAAIHHRMEDKTFGGRKNETEAASVTYDPEIQTSCITVTREGEKYTLALGADFSRSPDPFAALGMNAETLARDPNKTDKTHRFQILPQALAEQIVTEWREAKKVAEQSPPESVAPPPVQIPSEPVGGAAQVPPSAPTLKSSLTVGEQNISAAALHEFADALGKAVGAEGVRDRKAPPVPSFLEGDPAKPNRLDISKNGSTLTIHTPANGATSVTAMLDALGIPYQQEKERAPHNIPPETWAPMEEGAQDRVIKNLPVTGQSVMVDIKLLTTTIRQTMAITTEIEKTTPPPPPAPDPQALQALQDKVNGCIHAFAGTTGEPAASYYILKQNDEGHIVLGRGEALKGRPDDDLKAITDKLPEPLQTFLQSLHPTPEEAAKAGVMPDERTLDKRTAAFQAVLQEMMTTLGENLDHTKHQLDEINAARQKLSTALETLQAAADLDLMSATPAQIDAFQQARTGLVDALAERPNANRDELQALSGHQLVERTQEALKPLDTTLLQSTVDEQSRVLEALKGLGG